MPGQKRLIPLYQGIEKQIMKNELANKNKVFVVDDDLSMLEYVKSILKKWGYQFSSCNNGEECVEKIKEEKPDLILLDVMLTGIDGITVCRRLKSDKEISYIPIIITTSLTDSTTIRDAHAFGAIDYISKPFDKNLLKTKIEKAILQTPVK